MRRLEADKIGELLTLLESYRAVQVFSWKIEKDEFCSHSYRLMIHVLDLKYVHGMLELIGGITTFACFIYRVQSSSDSTLDIILY